MIDHTRPFTSYAWRILAFSYASKERWEEFNWCMSAAYSVGQTERLKISGNPPSTPAEVPAC
jgi:hypothetical protein